MVSTQAAKPSVVRLFVVPAREFAHTMIATRRASKVLDANALTSRQVEEDFVAEAKLSCPLFTAEHNAAAATLIHRAVHSYMDARRSLTDPTRADMDRVYHECFDHLESELEKITGDPTANHRYQHVWEKISSRPPVGKVLGSALLMQAVSGFEVLVADLVRGVLAAKPQILLDTNKQYKLRDLQAYSTIAELQETIAEEIADQTLRAGFDAWMTWFEANLKVAIPGVFQDSVQLTEVFQRRHLFVHNGGVVNDSYLAKLGDLKDPPETGASLRVTNAYLAESIDCLDAAGLKLSAAAAVKLGVGEDRTHAEEVMDHLCYEALQRGQYAVVVDVASWLIPLVQDEPARIRLQVNKWLAAKNLNGVESVRADVEAWDTRALEDNYKLAKLSLLEDLDGAVKLVKVLIDRGDLSEAEWRSWPLLSPVRTHAVATGADLPDTKGWDLGHEH